MLNFWSFIFKQRLVLVVVVLFIAGGLFMFTFHSTQFNMKGFVMVLSASLLSGLRWTLAQLVTQKNKLGKGRHEKDKVGKEGGGKINKIRDRKQQGGGREKTQRERKFRWIATPMHEVYVIFVACIFI